MEELNFKLIITLNNGEEKTLQECKNIDDENLQIECVKIIETTQNDEFVVEKKEISQQYLQPKNFFELMKKANMEDDESIYFEMFVTFLARLGWGDFEWYVENHSEEWYWDVDFYNSWKDFGKEMLYCFNEVDEDACNYEDVQDLLNCLTTKCDDDLAYWAECYAMPYIRYDIPFYYECKYGVLVGKPA